MLTEWEMVCDPQQFRITINLQKKINLVSFVSFYYTYYTIIYQKLLLRTIFKRKEKLTIISFHNNVSKL